MLRRYKKKKIDQFSSLISPSSTSSPTDLSNSITILSPSSFDPRNQYSNVFRAVRDAVTHDQTGADVEVRVYRVEISHSEVEYWVLGLDEGEGRIVGMRARGVET